MATLSRFDVALVQFPFIEKVGQKQRPAIVLSHAEFNADHRQFVGLMVTTATNTKWPSDVPITDIAAAGLKRPSVMRMKVVSVVDDLIVGKVGTLSVEDRAALRTAVEHLLLK